MDRLDLIRVDRDLAGEALRRTRPSSCCSATVSRSFGRRVERLRADAHLPHGPHAQPAAGAAGDDPCAGEQGVSVHAGVAAATGDWGIWRADILIESITANAAKSCRWSALASERQCSVSFPFVSTLGSEFVCRGAFALGAAIVAPFLVWLVLRALRQQNVA